MAKLIHSVDGKVVGEFALNKESVSIGRKEHNDIQLDSRNASGEHARILTLAEDSFLEDLKSTNGTRVNGKPINRHVLRNNDLIEIGSHGFTFVSAASQPADTGFEKTIVMRVPAAPSASAVPSAPAAPSVSAAPRDRGFFAKIMSWFK